MKNLKKPLFIFLSIFVAICMMSCPELFDPEGGDNSETGGSTSTAVTFSSLEADGNASTQTTQLTLTFNKDITGLVAGDITLSGSTGATKGAFNRTGTGTYTLGITGVTTSGQVTVAVSKAGYTISPSSRPATVYPAPSGGGSTPVTFSNLTANGSSGAQTTQLTLTFSAAITGLNANDIMFTAGTTGAVKGTLSGSGPTYTLGISGVTAEGTVTISSVTKSGYTITGTPKTATVYPTPVADGTVVTSWKDLAVVSVDATEGTTGTHYGTYQGKNDVLKLEPTTGKTHGWALLTYNLSAYANKEVIITMSANVLLTAGTSLTGNQKINWQVNNVTKPNDYPTIAESSTKTTGTWISVSGTKTLTPEAGKSLYLSSGDYGLPTNAVIYIADFTVTITEVGGGGGGGGTGGGDNDDSQRHGPPTGWTDPATQNTKLTTVANTYSGNSSGNKPLPNSSPYGYEVYLNQNLGTGVLKWYGASNGGGAAFRAEWDNPTKNNNFDFIARVGYYWGSGQNYTSYGNIYVDYNYTRSDRRQALVYSYIGVYGWSRNPSASDPNERLIEYYIVDDWLGNGWQGDNTVVGTGTTGGDEIGSFVVDGATYKVIKNVRNNAPSIDKEGDNFTQIFSIRQTLRPANAKAGTISVTEHFKEWEARGLTMGNLYECKFKVEAGGDTDRNDSSGVKDRDGWLELTYLKLSQEALRR